MRAENIGVWNRQHFYCGAFDVNSLKVVEVHKYEECEAVDFNSYWIFDKVVDAIQAEELFESNQWIFFWLDRVNGATKLHLQIEAETMNPTPMQLIQFEGVKSFIRKQISISDIKINRGK